MSEDEKWDEARAKLCDYITKVMKVTGDNYFTTTLLGDPEHDTVGLRHGVLLQGKFEQTVKPKFYWIPTMTLTFWHPVRDAERTDKDAFYYQHDFDDGTSALVKEVSIGTWQWFLMDEEEAGMPLRWSEQYFPNADSCMHDFEAALRAAMNNPNHQVPNQAAADQKAEP